MSNDPYDQGRSGGQPPSGPDFNEWWRGNQDYLKGLQQGGSGDTGPLLGDDGGWGTPTPQPVQFYNQDENPQFEGGGSPNVEGLGTGCLLVFLAPLTPLLLPLGFLAWMCLYPLSAAAALGAWLAGAWLVTDAHSRQVLQVSDLARLAIPLIAALVVMILATMLDQRLGRHMLYRVPRHFARLLCFGGMAGIGYVAMTRSHLLETPGETFGALARPDGIMLVVAAMTVAHFILWPNHHHKLRLNLPWADRSGD